MKLVLIYPPFCTPTVMPYSISYLKNFVENNLDIKVKCIDINAKFNRMRFSESYKELHKHKDIDSYGAFLEQFDNVSMPVYAENHQKILRKENPDLLKEMLDIIIKEKPDYVAFSFVYNSQCFYGAVLIDELKKKGIECIAGGPAVNSKITSKCLCLNNEVELVEFLAKKLGQKIDMKSMDCKTVPDFSDYEDKDYLVKEIIIPVRSSTTCYYKQCTFCTHYVKTHYFEFDIELIKKTIKNSKQKYFFFIDDMISRKRLLEIAKAVKPLKIKWWCQLRPTKDLLGCLKELADAGLKCISWGIESGSQRIIDKIKKGTDVKMIPKILQESHDAGIKNVAYIIFGFPSETKEEFVETIDFLKDNSKNIELVSSTIFGLKEGSYVYDHPDEFGLYDVVKHPRTMLDDNITYKVKSGMTQDDAKEMKRNYRKTLRKLTKLPKSFNHFKEQIILF
jgi:hypothetical protein